LYGVSNTNGAPSPAGANISGLIVQDNIITRVFVGVRGEGDGTHVSTGNQITGNLIDRVGAFDFGYGVTLRYNFYADVTNNVMTHVHAGITTLNFTAAGPATWNISGNNIHSYAAGLTETNTSALRPR